MARVKRIFRLRSAVRSDEMKAESTLPPGQPYTRATCRWGWLASDWRFF